MQHSHKMIERVHNLPRKRHCPHCQPTCQPQARLGICAKSISMVAVLRGVIDRLSARSPLWGNRKLVVSLVCVSQDHQTQTMRGRFWEDESTHGVRRKAGRISLIVTWTALGRLLTVPRDPRLNFQLSAFLSLCTKPTPNEDEL